MARKSRAPRVARRAKVSVHVTRREFNRVVSVLNKRASIFDEHAVVLSQIQRDLDVQFRRIAQIQQELEEIKKSVRKSA